MKKNLLIAIAALILIVSACKKDAPDFAGFDGDSGNGVDQPILSDNYQPTAKGTFWKYNITVPGLGADVSTVTMSGVAATLSGKVYQAGTTTYKTKATTDEVFFYKSGGSYSERDVTDGDIQKYYT